MVERFVYKLTILYYTLTNNNINYWLQIAKDARECVQECVSEFISFITSEASDRCFQEKRKTINGEDILYAMSNLGFDNYVEPLKMYLQKYREVILYLLLIKNIFLYIILKYLKATKGDKSIGIEELSDDVFCKLHLLSY